MDLEAAAKKYGKIFAFTIASIYAWNYLAKHYPNTFPPITSLGQG